MRSNILKKSFAAIAGLLLIICILHSAIRIFEADNIGVLQLIRQCLEIGLAIGIILERKKAICATSGLYMLLTLYDLLENQATSQLLETLSWVSLFVVTIVTTVISKEKVNRKIVSILSFFPAVLWLLRAIKFAQLTISYDLFFGRMKEIFIFYLIEVIALVAFGLWIVMDEKTEVKRTESGNKGMLQQTLTDKQLNDLRTLKSLMDSEIIDRNEFEAEKKKILENIYK